MIRTPEAAGRVELDILTLQEREALLGQTMTRLEAQSTEAGVIEVIRSVARAIAQAEGITIVKRIGDRTEFIAEDAAERLWTGLQFEIDKCLAGRAMTEAQSVIVPDITIVENIHLNAYLATFIRSLIAVPIGEGHPTHAICAYWRDSGPIDADTVTLIEALSRAMAAALARIARQRDFPSDRRS